MRVCSDVEQVVLRTTPCPGWASAIGRDSYGLWAEFTIEGKVDKRPGKRATKREAPPHGSARSGSPAPSLDSAGAVPHGVARRRAGAVRVEQLPHEVVIDEGFWMFETPCTQALWEAVLGENPSHFKSPDRPVERVTWDDCEKFVKKISEKIGLSLGLPSEAKWEYACRAGTTTSTYAGPLIIEGENNAPILDAIAWYRGNSGIEFELSDGEDASEWPEKQFQVGKAGTHPVASKKANPWGLHDMLGNVWEWCNDVWIAGISAGSDAAAHRVFRGGSWSSVARNVPRRTAATTSPRSGAGTWVSAVPRSGMVVSQVSKAEREGSEAQVAEQPETATRRAKRHGRKKS